MTNQLTETLVLATAALEAAIDGMTDTDAALDDVLSARLLVSTALFLLANSDIVDADVEVALRGERCG